MKIDHHSSAGWVHPRARLPRRPSLLLLAAAACLGAGCATSQYVTLKDLPEETYSQRYFVTLSNVDPAFPAGPFFEGFDKTTVKHTYSHLLPDTYLLTILGDSVSTLESMRDAAEANLPRQDQQTPVEFTWREDVIIRAMTSEDPLVSEQWSLSAADGVNLPLEDEPVSPGGATAVAVIDSGVHAEHPDLDGRVDTGLSALEVDTPGNADPWGHGTRIAGIISANPSNGLGIRGVAPNARVFPVEVYTEGIGSAGDAVKAFELIIEAGMPARVWNISWASRVHSEDLHTALDRLATYGVILVAPAGNHGADLSTDPVYPAAYDDLDHLIVVAATDERGDLADFSAWHSDRVLIAAPGRDVLSTIPFDSWSRSSGTSYAVPYVSGAIARYLDVRGGPTSKSAKEVTDALVISARKLPSLAGRVRAGGILDVQALLDI